MERALLPPNLLASTAAPATSSVPPLDVSHGSHRSAHHTRLRILSQNLYGAEAHEAQKRARTFAEALELLLPDVVGLQEVRRFNLEPLVASGVLRAAYPQLKAFEGTGAAEPPWTLVLTRAAPHLHFLGRRHFSGVGG